MRTPLSVLLSYEGAAVRGQNLWRRWMTEHNVPRFAGQFPGLIHYTCLGLRQREGSKIDGIDSYTSHGARFDQCARWRPARRPGAH